MKRTLQLLGILFVILDFLILPLFTDRRAPSGLLLALGLGLLLGSSEIGKARARWTIPILVLFSLGLWISYAFGYVWIIIALAVITGLALWLVERFS